MKLNDLLRRMIAQKYSTEPIEGKNLTGTGIKITNKITVQGIVLSAHYAGRDINETTIMDACTKLGIDPTIFK